MRKRIDPFTVGISNVPVSYGLRGRKSRRVSGAMGENSSNFLGENLPVENVTWYDVVVYCNARSEQEG